MKVLEIQKIIALEKCHTFKRRGKKKCTYHSAKGRLITQKQFRDIIKKNNKRLKTMHGKNLNLYAI